MRVQGTQQTVKQIEVNVDTVYVRSNIERVETKDFSGWEYDEVQYNKDEFIEKIQEENSSLQIAQAETNTTLLEFMEVILLGGM